MRHGVRYGGIKPRLSCRTIPLRIERNGAIVFGSLRYSSTVRYRLFQDGRSMVRMAPVRHRVRYMLCQYGTKYGTDGTSTARNTVQGCPNHPYRIVRSVPELQFPTPFEGINSIHFRLASRIVCLQCLSSNTPCMRESPRRRWHTRPSWSGGLRSCL